MRTALGRVVRKGLSGILWLQPILLRDKKGPAMGTSVGRDSEQRKPQGPEAEHVSPVFGTERKPMWMQLPEQMGARCAKSSGGDGGEVRENLAGHPEGFGFYFKRNEKLWGVSITRMI